ncbi:hypothetical protein N9Z54_02480 [Planctomycetota bacterium]|jgi:signal transduction histidine kinase|nr:hypothetical protein [Planctomycetota bacterium]
MLHLKPSLLALALVATAFLQTSAAAQGPDQGSPFVDAPLPFEALKAAPDSSFDILVASLGVFLLVPITAAAFMALARLRNMEEALQGELKQLREVVGASDRAGDGAEGVKISEAVQSLASALETRGDGQSSNEADRVIAALGELQAAQAASAKALADRLQEALVAVAASGAGHGAPHEELLSPLDAARLFLEELGYSDVKIVTPPQDLTPELLSGGAVIVEARREGATHKGKVLFEAGAPADAQLKGGHGMFP